MALQNFVDKAGPVIGAAWLNQVDNLLVTIMNGATTQAIARAGLTADLPLEIANGGTAARTPAAARLQLTADAPLEIANGGTGARTTAAIIAALGVLTVYDQNAQEISAVVTPTDTSEFYHTLQRYGGLSDNSTDDAIALSQALLVGTQSINGALGSYVSIPSGVTVLGSMIPLPNRVRVLGENKRGSYFKATAGWGVGNGSAPWNVATNYVAGNYVTSAGVLYIAKLAHINQVPPNATYWLPISNAMFYAQNGFNAGVGVSMFDSTLENVTVDCNNVAGLGGVLSSAWQEDCGLRGALITNFATYGIRFQDGMGGASLTKIENTEVFGGTTPATTGIDVPQISSVGGFMLRVSNTSITGSATENLAKGINIVNDTLFCDTVHFETCDSAIYLSGVGNCVLIGVTGAPTVTNLVEIDASWVGTLTMIGCFRNSAAVFIKDNRVGGIGMISGLDYPNFHLSGQVNKLPVVAPGANWSAGYFDGTAGSPTLAAGYNVANIVKNGTGDYTITETRARPTVACAPWVNCNNVNVTSRIDLVGTTTFRIRLYTATTGVAVDSNEIKFGNVRLF